ncbi:Bug family tripartite tricarboxylate transporter substrate binding protein [Roseomonas sp. GCM10028921]
MISRRALFASSLALPGGAAMAAPRFSSPPDLRFFIPAAPGGGWDGTGRAMEKVLRETRAAASLQFENVPGAGGTVGLPRFVSMRGRRNLLMVSGLTMISSTITNKSPIAVSQLTPIARLIGEVHVLVVPAESPIRDLAGFIAAFRADPKGTAVAGGSAGGTDHMLLGILGNALGIPPGQLSYVAFSGGGPAVTAIIGGQVKAGISNWSEFEPHVASGRMRALALSGMERLPNVDVPTMREGGLDAVLYNWRGVWAPPGIPESHRDELATLVEEMARSEEWKRECGNRGWQQLYMPPGEFGAFLRTETASVEGVLKQLGLAG